MNAETNDATDRMLTDVKTVLHEAQDVATEVMQEARGKVGAEIAADARQVGERIGDVADTLRDSADKLAEHEQWLGTLMANGADELGDIAGALQNNDLRGLVGQVETFARRQPSMFAGAAVAAGFVAARLARQSMRPGVRSSRPAMQAGSNQGGSNQVGPQGSEGVRR